MSSFASDSAIPFASLKIPGAILTTVINHARQCLPAECCGLLAGLGDGVVRKALPLVNHLASPTAFESEPRSMFEAMRAIRRENLEILAIYHSHPTSPPVPSRSDLEQSHGPGVVNLIVSLAAGAVEVRAWLYCNGRSVPFDWDELPAS